MDEQTPLLQREERVELPGDYSRQQREVNYGRMCTLIIREGTKQLRTYVKANLCRPVELEDLLNASKIKKEFRGLLKCRVLNLQQYEILYPKDGERLNENDVDISLWVILARNLLQDRHLINWGKTPGPQDDLPHHHILRSVTFRWNTRMIVYVSSFVR
jgi:hypothetical protein